jgi:hypothetical protein
MVFIGVKRGVGGREVCGIIQESNRWIGGGTELEGDDCTMEQFIDGSQMESKDVIC